METETVRLWRVRPEGATHWEPWKTGATPVGLHRGAELEIAWALLAEEPGDASGRPPSPGDQLIGFCEGNEASLVVAKHVPTDEWRATLIWTADREQVVDATGDTVVDVIQNALGGAGA